MASADLPEALASILAGELRPGLDISALKRLTGGTSHDSWAFDATDAGGAVHRLILRRDLSDERLDLPTDIEFALLSRLHAAGIAVPRPLVMTDAAGPLGTAGIVSERLAGGDVRKMMAARAAPQEGLGVKLVGLLAQLHRYDWRIGLRDIYPDPGDEAAAGLVARWKQTADGFALCDPLLRGALTWLQSHAPVATPLALVHGDFKANNLVWDGADRFVMIDWELAHIGDPLEDLAWAMVWTTPHDLVGGMLTPTGFVAAYEAATGGPVNRARLAFWQLFALVKLRIIFFQSMGLRGRTGPAHPTHVMLERAVPWLQRQMANRLTAALALEQAA